MQKIEPVSVKKFPHFEAISLAEKLVQKIEPVSVWSDRKLAELCGVHHQLVALVRGELDDSSSSPPDAPNPAAVTVGADSKQPSK